MFDLLMGMLLIFGGMFALVSIFIEKIRIPWKGSNATAGPITCLGFGISFIAMGILIVSGDGKDEVAPPGYGIAILLGLGLIVVGFIRDFGDPKSYEE